MRTTERVEQAQWYGLRIGEDIEMRMRRDRLPHGIDRDRLPEAIPVVAWTSELITELTVLMEPAGLPRPQVPEGEGARGRRPSGDRQGR